MIKAAAIKQHPVGITFLLGGTLLVVADAVARTAFAPLELPVGVVTALIGVPVFVWLVRRWAS